MGFYDGSAVKNLPLMQETEETWFRSLSQQDPLEEEMETHFSIFAWKIPWSKESGGLQSMESFQISRKKFAYCVQLCSILHSKLINQLLGTYWLPSKSWCWETVICKTLRSVVEICKCFNLGTWLNSLREMS